MKIALAQMNVIPGMPEKNVANMLEEIKSAKEKKVDLIVFPEMCVGGYFLGDKWLDEDYCLNLMSFNELLKKASKGIAIAYGNVYVDKEASNKNWHPNKDGRVRKYNAIYVFQNEKPCLKAKETKIIPEGIQPKNLLPNYRIFDDERYFFSLKDIALDYDVEIEELVQPFILDIKGKKTNIGFELCEDLWCEDYRRKLKPLNLTKILIDNGSDLICNLSSSPWTYGKNSARDRRVLFIKEDCKEFKPFFYINCVGVQNNGKDIITFDGGSTVYNLEGLPIILSQKPHEQELIIVEQGDFNKNPTKRIEKSKIEQKYESIIQGIRSQKDLLNWTEQPSYMIGLSGGIDSSVVACLLVKAVGKEKVIGVNMPSKYNSQKTKGVAKEVADKLGIKYVVIPIEDMSVLNQKLLNGADVYGDKKQLTISNIENIQAKIRATSILSNLAAKYDGLFTNNGNKLETALGYTTLYGDVGGAIAPIADLTKAEVVELAVFLNEKIFKKQIISKLLIPNELWQFREEQIQPSAELKDNQVDPMKFLYHDALLEAFTDYQKKSAEKIMQWYLDGEIEQKLRINLELIKRWNIDNPAEFVKDLEWFDRSIQVSVFKRVQSPPIIITSKSAYGYDVRESILPYTQSKKYLELKKKVLLMKEYKPKNN